MIELDQSSQSAAEKDDEAEVRKALIDLYLSVKIRKNEEIDKFDSKQLDKERNELMEEQYPILTLVNYIQTSIEILMKLKNEQEVREVDQCIRCKKEINTKLKDRKKRLEMKQNQEDQEEVKIDTSRKFVHSTKGKIRESCISSVLEAPQEYEDLLQQYEKSVRNHIQCEQQLQIHIDFLQDKLDTKDKEDRYYKPKIEERIKQL